MNSKKAIWRTLAGVILFICILAVCIRGVSLLTERKTAYEKNAVFMEEAKKGHLDVLWVGSSHVINGINPLRIYEKAGITSYDLGGYSAVLKTSYWNLKLALQYCHPKVVMIDTYMVDDDVFYQDAPEANGDKSELHLNLDNYPLTKLKWEALRDLFEKSETRKEFLFDFQVYHDRWKELDENDFRRLTNSARVNRLMGADFKYTVYNRKINYLRAEKDRDTFKETVGTQYLRKMIEECQAAGIEPVLMTLPFNASASDQQAAWMAEEIAEEYGVPCLNLLGTDVIDLDLDLIDNGHMNISGAEKVSDFMAEWLSEHKDLADHRGESGYENWEELAEEFRNSQEEMALGQENLYTQLMMLARSDRSYILYIAGDSYVYADHKIGRLLGQLSGTAVPSVAAEGDLPYFLMNDHGGIYEWAGTAEAAQIPSSAGVLEYYPLMNDFAMLTLESDKEENLLYSSKYPEAVVHLLFFDEDGEGFSEHQIYIGEESPYIYRNL